VSVGHAGAVRAACGAALLLACVLPARARAQGQRAPGPEPELRVDALTDRTGTALQLGAGVDIPAGYYMRLGIVGAAGARVYDRDGSDSGTGATARVDLLARFLLDPFRQSRWGLSAGGGVSFRADRGRVGRPFLLTVLDLEGPRASNGISPAFQLGLGGGVRLGAAIRWGSVRAR
jgi:hypothetical protein